jgi:hypothetical protein
MILLALGTAVAVVGAAVFADEWRLPPRYRRSRGMRIEFVLGAAVLIGLGVGMGYAGLAS